MKKTKNKNKPPQVTSNKKLTTPELLNVPIKIWLGIQPAFKHPTIYWKKPSKIELKFAKLYGEEIIEALICKIK